MSLVGIIFREPRLQMDEWLRCIERHSDLARQTPREGINPFTGAPTVYKPGPGDVIILLESVGIGAISPSDEFEEDGELEVWAPSSSVLANERVKAFAQRIVEELGATLEWLADKAASGEEEQ